MQPSTLLQLQQQLRQPLAKDRQQMQQLHLSEQVVGAQQVAAMQLQQQQWQPVWVYLQETVW